MTIKERAEQIVRDLNLVFPDDTEYLVKQLEGVAEDCRAVVEDNFPYLSAGLIIAAFNEKINPTKKE